MPFRTNLFTGKLEEIEPVGEGRQIIYREKIPEHLQQARSCNPWSTPWRSAALKIHPDQVDKFNEDIKRFGGGGRYLTDGTLECETRGGRSRELKRRGFFDKDAGYGDYAGQ